MKQNRSNHQGGFSLIEAILAITILGIAVTGILTTFSTAMVAAKVSEDYSTASIMMTELKTHVRANLFSPLQINQGTFTNQPRFSWQVNYTTTSLSNLYLVNLLVTWQQGNKTYRLTYDTYHYYEVTEEGLEQ